MNIAQPDKFLTAPRAVLVDLDNTLYPYDPANRAGLRAVEAKVQSLLGVPADAFRASLGAARAEVKAAVGPVASSHSRLLYFQRALEDLGLGSQVLVALDLEQSYWRAYLIEATLFEGARAFLEELRLRGIPVAVVSDLTAQIQFRKLVVLEIDTYFDYVVTSEEAGVEKPDPRPFEMALLKMGIDNGPVWVIGDSAERDMGIVATRPTFVGIQKIHAGVAAAEGISAAAASFTAFDALRRFTAQVVEGAHGH